MRRPSPGTRGPDVSNIIGPYVSNNLMKLQGHVADIPLYMHFECLTTGALVYLAKPGNMEKGGSVSAIHWDTALAAVKKASEEFVPSTGPSHSKDTLQTTHLSLRQYKCVLIFYNIFQNTYFESQQDRKDWT